MNKTTEQEGSLKLAGFIFSSFSKEDTVRSVEAYMSVKLCESMGIHSASVELSDDGEDVEIWLWGADVRVEYDRTDDDGVFMWRVYDYTNSSLNRVASMELDKNDEHGTPYADKVVSLLKQCCSMFPSEMEFV